MDWSDPRSEPLADILDWARRAETMKSDSHPIHVEQDEAGQTWVVEGTMRIRIEELLEIGV